MTVLTDLPVELLSRVASAVGETIHNEETFSSPDLTSLPALRSVCKMMSQICAPYLFDVVRVLPRRKSAARYTKILKSDTLNQYVRKVVFQTRMYGDDYDEPYDFFLDAVEELGRFQNLTSVELVFDKECTGGNFRWYNDHLSEQIEFREEILEKFFDSLNHEDHPATGVRSLSIKNLQDRTPTALTGTKESNKFKTNFEQVMSRIHHLSLQIVTEYYEAAPEHTLQIPEAHEFFNDELNDYWLEPIRENVTSLKLYSAEMYWGYFPRCNLPRFPNLRTLILGNMSFTHDAQLEWILSHAEKLEELILDDCPLTVGARFFENDFGPDRHVIRGERPEPPAKTWSYGVRWHSHFDKIRTGLPNLRHFAYGHGPWNERCAFDEAESLTSSLPEDRYQYFDEGTGPSNWLGPGYGGVFNGGDDEENLVHKPTCDDEDRRALDELLSEIQKKRQIRPGGMITKLRG